MEAWINNEEDKQINGTWRKCGLETKMVGEGGGKQHGEIRTEDQGKEETNEQRSEAGMKDKR